jgi:hypothetical protein
MITQTAQPADSSVIKYLAVMPAAQRRHLLDLAREVTAQCEDWLRAYPIVLRPSVTEACSLVSAIALPVAAPAELRLLTCWWLWIFGVDDLFDDPAADDGQIALWTDRFASDPPINPADDDPLRAALGSIHDALSSYPLFACLAGRWRTGMAGIVQGMLTERRWSVSAPPAFQAYLANGMTTIAVRPYALTGCILAGEAGAAAGFETLDPMINAAARCFRLANDLRSDSRERQEGKLNALTLLLGEYSADGTRDAAALSAARRRLRDICAADLEYLDRARQAAPAQIATLARFLWAHTAFIWDMYQAGDYDAVSALLRDGVISLGDTILDLPGDRREAALLRELHRLENQQTELILDAPGHVGARLLDVGSGWGGQTGHARGGQAAPPGSIALVGRDAELVLDNVSNAPVGSFSVANAGGWASWTTIPANMTMVTGTHNMFLKFSSGASAPQPSSASTTSPSRWPDDARPRLHPALMPAAGACIRVPRSRWVSRECHRPELVIEAMPRRKAASAAESPSSCQSWW